MFTEGDKEAGVWTAGQVAGLIDDVPTCEELLSRMEKVRSHRLRNILIFLGSRRDSWKHCEKDHHHSIEIVGITGSEFILGSSCGPPEIQ